MLQELLHDDALPYREILSRPGERLDYGIEWAGWLANRWAAATSLAAGFKVRPIKSTGYQYVATAGLSGFKEPIWPTIIGGTVVDGSITWTCQAADTTSLAATIQSSAWTADLPLTVPTPSLTGTNATAYVDVPSNCSDGDYYVRNTITLQGSGLNKKGLFLFKVRAGSN